MTSPPAVDLQRFLPLAPAAQVSAHLPRRVRTDDAEWLVVRRPNGFVVTESRCPHQQEPLEYGVVMGDTLTCPYHGYVFRLDTGACNVRRCEPLLVREAVEIDGWVCMVLNPQSGEAL